MKRDYLNYVIDPGSLASMQWVAQAFLKSELYSAQDSNFNKFSAHSQDSSSVNHFLIFSLFVLPPKEDFQNTLLGMKLAHYEKKRAFKKVVHDETISRSAINSAEAQAAAQIAAWMILLHSEIVARQRLFYLQHGDLFKSIQVVQQACFAEKESRERCKLTQSFAGQWGSLQQQFRTQCKEVKLQEQIRIFQAACRRHHACLNTLRETLQNFIDDKETEVALKVSAVSTMTFFQIGVDLFDVIIQARENQQSILLSIYITCRLVRWSLTRFKRASDELTDRNAALVILRRTVNFNLLNDLLHDSTFKHYPLFCDKKTSPSDYKKLDQFISALARVYDFYFYMIVAVHFLKLFLPDEFVAIATEQKTRLVELMPILFQLYDTNAVVTVKNFSGNGRVRCYVEWILQGLEATKTAPVTPLLIAGRFLHPAAHEFCVSLLGELPEVIEEFKKARNTIFPPQKTASAASTAHGPRVK